MAEHDTPKPPVGRHSIYDDLELYGGLTLYTQAVSAQVRDYGVVVHVMDLAPREQGDVLLSVAEARRLRDLLNVATARGYL